MLAEQADTLCVKVRVMQKAPLHITRAWFKELTQAGRESQAAQKNRWCSFLNLQCFLLCPHPLQAYEMTYLINSRDFCKHNV